MSRSRKSSPISDQLSLRARRDLIWSQRCDTHGVPTGMHVVKDPLSLRYWLLSEHESRVLGWLRQPVSLAVLKSKLESQFFPKRTTHRELQSVVGMLHRRGLLIGEDEGQAEQLLLRRSQNERRQTWQWANLLMLKLPGINISDFLDRFTTRLSVLFRPTVVLLWMVFAFVIAMMVMSRWQTLLADLPVLDELLTWRTGGMLMVSLAIAKVWHELGHAVVCTKLGARCHEIGAALFFFSPCLFCDTSDCWLLPQRWKRVTVALAGVGAELVLASIVGLVWCLSQPGTFRQQLFYLLATCTVFSWFINLNPLLRYDGYFVLSDWLNEPNLAQRSKEHLGIVMRRFWRSNDLTPARATSQSRQLVYLAYALASLAYRCVVIGAALFFVWRLLESYQMVGIGWLLIVVALAAMVWQPSHKVWKWMRTPTNRQRTGIGVWLFRGVVVAGIGSFAFAPLPRHVTLDGSLRPSVDHSVYLSVPGRVGVESLALMDGTFVDAGDVLAQLGNPQLEDRQRELQQQLEAGTLKLRQLKRRQGSDANSAARIQSAQEQLEQLGESAELLRNELSALTLRAPFAGRVLFAESPVRQTSSRDVEGSVDSLDLRTWSGYPVDPINLAAWLESGTLLCRIVDDGAWEIRCDAAEASLEALREGAAAVGLLCVLPSDGSSSLVNGKVTTVSSSPRRQSADESKKPPGYEVKIALDVKVPVALDGTQAKVRVRCGSRSLVQRLQRWLNEQFSY